MTSVDGSMGIVLATAATDITLWYRGLPDRKVLGVSRNYLIKLAVEHKLETSDLDVLVAVRTQLGGSFAGARKLLRKGLSVGEIYNLYQARAGAMALLDDIGSISLGAIKKLSDTFPSLDLDSEGAGETIADIILEVWQCRGFHRQYPDTIIAYLCGAAKEYGVADVRTILDYLRLC